MADFVQNANVKSAVRKLAEPFADVTAFNTVVQSIITGNPFACVSYMLGGVNHPPVEKTRENYTAKIVYTDPTAKKVGNNSQQYNSVAGFTAGAAAELANTANNTAHNGTPSRDFGADTYSVTIKCRDPNGELYNLTLSRDQVTLTSYEDDAIRTKVETWADSVPALA
jgi:hypothetical protein